MIRGAHLGGALGSVTDSTDSKETVVSTHCSTTTDKGQTRWRASVKCSDSFKKKKYAKTQCGHDSLFCGLTNAHGSFYVTNVYMSSSTSR